MNIIDFLVSGSKSTTGQQKDEYIKASTHAEARKLFESKNPGFKSFNSKTGVEKKPK